MKINKFINLSVQHYLGAMLCLIVLFAIVSVFSVFQLHKVSNFHRLNTLHLKYINELDQNIFGANVKSPPRDNIIKSVIGIREQPIECLNQINIFDRLFMEIFSAQRAITLCEQDIIIADQVLLKLNSIDDYLLSDDKLLLYLQEASKQFTSHSKEFEMYTSMMVNKVIQVSMWLFIPVSTLLMILSITVYRFVMNYSNEIDAKNNALTMAEMENRRMAFYDELTGLPNRNLFNDRLDKAIKNAKRNNSKLALMFLDLDRFKHVNDTYGHVVGDKLIQEASVRFSLQLRKSDTLARFGGDEFVLLAEDLRHEQDVAKIANKLIECTKNTFMIDGKKLNVTTSVGISIYPQDGDNPECLLKNADVAMYVSKSRGKNQYCIQDEEIKQKAERLCQIENRLKSAIKDESLMLVYQPVIDFRTGKMKGAEALLRWHDEELGFVSPDEFISVAEDSGQIIPIGEWVYETACKKIAEWRELHGKNIYLSVNVSGRQLKHPHFIDFITNTLEKYKLPANAINIEITENVFYSDDKRCTDTIHKLKQIGITLLLDDFGTGYSSLSTLTSLPFDFVKIDKSFLMHANEKDLITANTIIDMAKNFNMGVIAEGIEHTSTAQFLLERGCEFGQGYLFSKPCPAEEIDLTKDYAAFFEETNNEGKSIITFPRTA